MVDMFPVLRVLGMLVMIFASSLALPMAVSWWTRDGVLFVYPLSMAATAFVGAWLWWSFRVFRRELQPRHGVMLVSLVWALYFVLFGLLHLAFAFIWPQHWLDFKVWGSMGITLVFMVLNVLALKPYLRQDQPPR